MFCNGTLFLLKVSSSEQCGLLCLNSNTATDELYSDDVCSGFEYNAENKNCVLGTIDESLEASETTKTVMLKYVEPWLIPVTKSKYNMYFQDWQFCTFFIFYVIKIEIYEFDYCILESYSCNTDNTCCGEETSLTCCTSVAPCSVGEGGCTSDSYCSGDLVCGTGNCDISLGFTAGAIFYIRVQHFRSEQILKAKSL